MKTKTQLFLIITIIIGIAHTTGCKKDAPLEIRERPVIDSITSNPQEENDTIKINSLDKATFTLYGTYDSIKWQLYNGEGSPSGSKSRTASNLYIATGIYPVKVIIWKDGYDSTVTKYVQIMKVSLQGTITLSQKGKDLGWTMAECYVHIWNQETQTWDFLTITKSGFIIDKKLRINQTIKIQFTLAAERQKDDPNPYIEPVVVEIKLTKERNIYNISFPN